MLSQFDAGDWIQGIIVLMILAGSVLGPVAKALIKAFSPKEPDQRKSGFEGEWTVVRRPPPPDRPMARPLPPDVGGRRNTMEIEQSDVPPPQPPARGLPEPLREILSEIMPDIVPPTPKPLPPAKPRPPRQRDVARGAETIRPDRSRVPRVDRPRPARPQIPIETPRPHVSRSKESVERTAARARQADDVVAHEDIGAHVEGHIGYLGSQVERRLAASGAQTDKELRPTGILDIAQFRDRSSLRRAIILSEILAPPLALRSGGQDVAPI